VASTASPVTIVGAVGVGVLVGRAVLANRGDPATTANTICSDTEMPLTFSGEMNIWYGDRAHPAGRAGGRINHREPLT
jgi:hypothetical protein